MMAQKALFFMDTMRVTQGINVGSHRNSLAVDFGGKDTGIDAIYAPFDGTVARVRTGSSHETYFQSTGKVLCADGVEREVTMTLMHDNYVNVRDGQTLKQGEKLGDEGSYFGGRHGAVGNHAHVEFSAGHQKNQIYSNGTWVTPNQIAVEKVLFVPEKTKIMYDGGFKWVRIVETTPQLAKYTATVMVNGLRLRTLPKTDADAVQIDSLKAGAKYPLTQTKDGWAFLAVADNVGGWACISDGNATYLQIDEV